MREVPFDRAADSSFAACLETILELEPHTVPRPNPGEDAAVGWTVTRWLGGRGLGLVAVEDAVGFSWAGPWIGSVRSAGGERGSVVMYGVPSGVVWDPVELTRASGWELEGGFVVSALDVALALPPRLAAPLTAGVIEAIWIAAEAGAPATFTPSAEALPDLGLDGDRHVIGAGTFPSGAPGSALTLIESEVCDSFDPPLGPDEHRRNLLTRGIELNGLVGREFTVGAVRCRGMRLCEPCTVVQGYSERSVLRPLVHRGGLRADILERGRISVGDEIAVS